VEGVDVDHVAEFAGEGEEGKRHVGCESRWLGGEVGGCFRWFGCRDVEVLLDWIDGSMARLMGD